MLGGTIDVADCCTVTGDIALEAPFFAQNVSEEHLIARTWQTALAIADATTIAGFAWII